MNAALEIAKASAGASISHVGTSKVEWDLKNASAEVAKLAKAIRDFMDA